MDLISDLLHIKLKRVPVLLVYCCGMLVDFSLRRVNNVFSFSLFYHVKCCKMDMFRYGSKKSIQNAIMPVLLLCLQYNDEILIPKGLENVSNCDKYRLHGAY